MLLLSRKGNARFAMSSSLSKRNPAGNWPVPTLQPQGTGLGWCWAAFQHYWLEYKRRVLGWGEGGAASEIMSLSYELYGACWKNTKHLTQDSDVQILQFLLNFPKGVVFCQVCHDHFHTFPRGFTWRWEMGGSGVQCSQLTSYVMVSNVTSPNDRHMWGCFFFLYLFLGPPSPDLLCSCLWWPRSFLAEPAAGGIGGVAGGETAGRSRNCKINESTRTLYKDMF